MLLAMTSLAYAVPAFKGEITFVQADGTTFKGHIKGDEHFHWSELKNKSVVVFNKKSKNYEYAKVGRDAEGKESLMASGMKAKAGKVNPYRLDRKVLNLMWKDKRTKRMHNMR